MKKCSLFPLLDKNEKQLHQAQSISQLAVLAGGLNECPLDAVCGSLSVVCDLLKQLDKNSKTISDAIAQLYIVDSAVRGQND